MRKILLFIFISLISLIRTKEICDPLRAENDFPQGSLSKNTKILNGILDFKSVANVTSLRECILNCCQDKKCNFAFLKDSTNCFLITCSDTEENSCQIGQNLKKLPTDPVDYLVLIKPIQKSNIESLIRKEKEDLNAFFASQSFENQCSPNENTCEENEKCLFNKLNNVYECVCPREFGFYKIEGVCREYLSNTNGCELYIDQCPKDEECIAKNDVSKHGTCQCKINYRRNLDTFKCEPVDNRQTKMPKNNRKRPIVTQEMITSDPDDTFWKNLLAQLGIMENKNNKKYERTTPYLTTTTTKITDPPKIFTSNLQANAGFDLNVYYPSRMCTLNGSLTSFLQEKRITRWEWSKDSSSPAFGRFVDTNTAPVVMYENMIEGEYKFILKVWNTNGEMSQDFVHVNVHGSANENLHQFDKAETINENSIEIELDIEPSLFSESLKIEFLNKLENFLKNNKEFKLIDPKLFLMSTRISFESYKSTVVLELLVTDVANTSVLIPRGLSEDLTMGNLSRKICSSQNIVHQMRKKQKSFKHLLNSIQTIIERIHTNGIRNETFLKSLETYNKRTKILDFMNVRILSIRQMTCFDDRLFDSTGLKIAYNCSNHGRCDMYSRKCICDKYWMHNFVRYYFNYEADLTNANNCEFNIPLTIFVVFLITMAVYVILKMLFNYFLYYLCCCCLCRRRVDLKKKSGRLMGRNNDDSYLNDSMDDYDDLIKKQKKSRGFLDRLKSGSRRANHKYALLQSEESESLNTSSKDESFFKKNGLLSQEQLGAQLTLNDDEDIIYEETMVKDSKKHKVNNTDSIKKYNLI